MEDLVYKYSLEGSVNKAKAVKRILRAEAQDQMYSSLRRYLKPGTQTLTYVEVPTNPQDDPKTATTWRKVFDKAELEEILHERNRKHFAQAATDGTPFTQDPL